jgi:serine/threonine protein kinase
MARGDNPAGHSLGKDRRYRLLGQISEDPIGSLWQAEDAFLKWPVTIRVLREELGANERFRRVLRAELRAVWPRLEHPNIANTIYYSELQERQCFVVMQALDGETLAQRLRRTGTLEGWEALRITSQVEEALAAAHEIGLVHGGLSPDSVVLTQGGAVKVIDIGIPTALWVAAREAWTTLPEDSSAHLKEPAARAPDRSVDARGLDLLRQRMISAPLVAAEDDPSRLVDVALATSSQTAHAVVRPPQRPPWRGRRVLPGLAPFVGGIRAVTSAAARVARAVGRIPRQARVSAIAVSVLTVALTATAVVVLTSGPSPRRPIQRPLAVRTMPSSATTKTFGVTVPEVEGLSATEARVALERAGLLVVDAEPTPGPPGKVVDTDPAVSAIVERGSPIVLYVGASADRLRAES